MSAKCLDCCVVSAQKSDSAPLPIAVCIRTGWGHNPSRKGKGGNAGHFAPKSTAQVGGSDDTEIEETWYTALDDKKISAVELG